MKTNALRHAACCACLLAASPAPADDAAHLALPDAASGIFSDYRAWRPPARIDWRTANDRVAGFDAAPDAAASPAGDGDAAPAQADHGHHHHHH